MTKYHAVRTWSELNQRWFASKGEAKRADELALLQRAGEICGLEFQKRFILCEKPRRRTITIDFTYIENYHRVYEDYKGYMTRDFQTKLLWLKEKHGIDVRITHR